VNCWGTKVVFDLDKEIGLERQESWGEWHGKNYSAI
jgi:hypothetical protein